ncbi:methyltransferase domain-containing protein [Sphaerisporangium aureirubrum]|uniref:Protein-L-isoaspartate O-methyltransferase n=1 Tax=Sphaerisporangium aureirubrum TaxID=1544736 RepID=A0ABW1NDX3_9ACTN
MMHARTLAAHLIQERVLNPGEHDSQAWLAALQTVPRYPFVPTRAWAEPRDNRQPHLIDRDAAPAHWWEALYSDTTIVTQRGDGAAQIDDIAAPATSSLSCPRIALQMLRLLNLTKDHEHQQDVLEIGTGTGWTAAMLDWRTGAAGRVTTLEVDERIAAQARDNLAYCGRGTVNVVTGDGTHGHFRGTAYDRVHVTCGVRDIPYAWVEQTRPGGVIVAPWMPAHGQWGELLQLLVRGDGTAMGRFHAHARFMMLRTQRVPRHWPPYDGPSIQSAGTVPPRLTTLRDAGFGLFLAMAAPHLVVTDVGLEEITGRGLVYTMRLRELGGDSWAVAAASRELGPVDVRQGGGPRRLWDELEAAHTSWRRAGMPGREQFGMTVSAGGQRLWLDNPNQPQGEDPYR